MSIYGRREDRRYAEAEYTNLGKVVHYANQATIFFKGAFPKPEQLSAVHNSEQAKAPNHPSGLLLCSAILSRLFSQRPPSNVLMKPPIVQQQQFISRPHKNRHYPLQRCMAPVWRTSVHPALCSSSPPHTTQYTLDKCPRCWHHK